MNYGRAVKRKDDIRDGMLLLRDASVADLDELFRQVTVEAAKESLDRGLPVVGTDAEGRIVQTAPATDRISAKKPKSKSRELAVD
jgi:alpha-D-ribose 1-methylphosphonate 5-triphosphate synthase subunit PhnL